MGNKRVAMSIIFISFLLYHMFDIKTIGFSLADRVHEVALPLFDIGDTVYKTESFNQLPTATKGRLLRWAEREYDNHEWWDDDEQDWRDNIFDYLHWINQNYPRALFLNPGEKPPTHGPTQKQIKEMQRKRHQQYIAARARRRKAYDRDEPSAQEEALQKLIRSAKRSRERERRVQEKWFHDFKHFI